MQQILSKIKPEDFLVTKWSGGLTKQLAICPPDANYGEHTFVWRVSSASVETHESTFTPLPGYQRYLATIEGSIFVQHGQDEGFTLMPGEVDVFDGGAPTTSKGKCQDFNLMLRRGCVTGNMFVLNLPRGAKVRLPLLINMDKKTVVIYCTQGAAHIEDSLVAEEVVQGEALCIEDAAEIKVVCAEAATFYVAEINEPREE